ncbi:anthranilate N-methyltransferase-like [Camellia sinensis]|uniref:anthranilate N-methyltransferase-like n=1 Tax=Camellia sinensis TaxID=4442 RepID=UPI001036936B|nr:anthranilate N-methyltransferase-like [Camellia sinensis]
MEEGIPFKRVHGTHAFEYPGKDPRFNEVFNKAMINHTTIVINKILQCSPYKGFGQLNLNHKKLVDVGGGLGVTLSIITPNTTHIKAINFDLPHVIQHAPPYPGVEHVAADMFESVPKGDAIFMKLLKNFDAAHTALPDNGKVIVVEGMIPVIPDPSTAAKSMCQIDLVMMTQIPGGKERTQNEFLALAIGAGFTGISLECFICNFWEFRRQSMWNIENGLLRGATQVNNDDPC